MSDQLEYARVTCVLSGSDIVATHLRMIKSACAITMTTAYWTTAAVIGRFSVIISTGMERVDFTPEV